MVVFIGPKATEALKEIAALNAWEPPSNRAYCFTPIQDRLPPDNQFGLYQSNGSRAKMFGRALSTVKRADKRFELAEMARCATDIGRANVADRTECTGAQQIGGIGSEGGAP
jgi:hypothetical protein